MSTATPTATPSAHTLVELLRQQAERYGDKVAFSFSYNGDGEDAAQLTYRELDFKARAIAANLQRQGAAGERVLVLVRPGLDFVAGFFGCLYAGAVAVPVHQKLAPRLAVVVPDAQAQFALTAAESQAAIRAVVDGIEGAPRHWLFTDADPADADTWTIPDIDASTPAIIQYTSGSTRAPKGVLLTHDNVLHNVAAIQQAWNGDDSDVGVFWVPPHHDLGLIGGILSMLYIGCTTYLMSPTAFIQRPLRWLELISRVGGVITAAPNFAYDRCVETSTAAERAALDLSSLTTAMNGAEAVRATTLAAFADAFAPSGFRLESFYPVYGMAEATLQISAGSPSGVPGVRYLDRTALGEDRIVDVAADDPHAATFVGCGQPRGEEVVIVDPENGRPCGPDAVGEIWVAGPNIAQGYWRRPEETEQTFAGFRADTGDGPFLRTGDLGFLCAGELFITGRCKDLVVIDGHHYYPNDIEFTVQGCHPGMVSGRGAVFAVTPESGGVEQLVVAQEVDRAVGEAEFTQLVQVIQAALTKHHGIRADSVVLVEARRLPTTSSGKIQRGACRQLFLNRDLETVAEWHAPLPPTPSANPGPAEMAEFIKVTLAARASRQG